jgi:hypothetical protein
MLKEIPLTIEPGIIRRMRVESLPPQERRLRLDSSCKGILYSCDWHLMHVYAKAKYSLY